MSEETKAPAAETEKDERAGWQIKLDMDAEQIVDMLTTSGNVELVNVYAEHGKLKKSLSISGILEAANYAKRFSLTHWEYKETDLQFTGFAVVTDLSCNVARLGVSVAQKKDSKARVDEHAITKALHQAQRNAIDHHLTSKIRKPIIDHYEAAARQLEESKTGKRLPSDNKPKPNKPSSSSTSDTRAWPASQEQPTPPKPETTTPPPTTEQPNYKDDPETKDMRLQVVSFVIDHSEFITSAFGSADTFWKAVMTRYNAKNSAVMPAVSWKNLRDGCLAAENQKNEEGVLAIQTFLEYTPPTP